MRQSRIGSLIEAFANVLIGFWINYAANLIILPLFGFKSLTPGTNFIIGLLYTVISMVRSYVLRRWFNAKLHAAALKLAAGVHHHD
jgi:hypothetical protein